MGQAQCTATSALLRGRARLLHLPEAADPLDAADHAGLKRAAARLIQQVHLVDAHEGDLWQAKHDKCTASEAAVLHLEQ